MKKQIAISVGRFPVDGGNLIFRLPGVHVPLKAITTVAGSEGGYSTIPYVNGTSEPIKRVLENHGIKVAFKPYQTISQMFPKWTKKKLVIPLQHSLR